MLPEMRMLLAEEIPTNSDLAIYYSGPKLSVGPMPALFYFALSGRDSLELEPYNQPAVLLKNTPIRVFSFTIPGHGPNLKNTDALKHWAKSFARGENPINTFVEKALENIEFLLHSNYIDPQKIAVAGLSRGAFIATHLAAKEERITHILGFAPLTKLDLVQEFQNLNIANANLETLIPSLFHKRIRFYIGNHDTRVSTEECFNFILKLAKSATEKRVRNLNFELNVVPSIGHLGHGTSPETFLNGINWLKTNLGIL